jgi:Flp pilus assembly pilin Flp
VPELGATMVEYSLVLLLIAIGTIALVHVLGISVLDMFTAALDSF